MNRLTKDENALEDMFAREDEQVSRHGYSMHYVCGDHSSPTGVNLHTHGLRENLGHPDLQIVVPVTPATGAGIIRRIVDRIKGGERFAEGRDYGGVIVDYDVRFVPAVEGGRDLFRVILPDRTGALGPDMVDPFCRQYDDLAARRIYNRRPLRYHRE